MPSLTYNPAIFEQPTVDQAKRIILTPEGGQTTDERWAKETPYLGELLGRLLAPRAGGLIVDFGCGIGRLRKGQRREWGRRHVLQLQAL